MADASTPNIASLLDKDACLVIVQYAFISACVSEVIAYLFLFSRNDLGRLQTMWARAQKKLEKQKEVMQLANPTSESSSSSSSSSSTSSSTTSSSSSSSAKGKEKTKGKEKKLSGSDKKLQQMEREFDAVNNQLIRIKSRSGFFTAAVHAVTFFWMKAHFDGVVLARLPFHPWGFVQSLSHRNVPGVDVQDCGVIFIYALCSLAVKPNLQRLIGQTPPKTGIPLYAQRTAEKWTGVKLDDM